MNREQMKEVADRSWGQEQGVPSVRTQPGRTAALIRPVWPDPATENAMLESAWLLESEFEPTSTGHDAACHVKALLTRVRELEGLVSEMRTACITSREHLTECGNVLRGFVGLPRVASLAHGQADHLARVIGKIDQ